MIHSLNDISNYLRNKNIENFKMYDEKEIDIVLNTYEKMILIHDTIIASAS